MDTALQLVALTLAAGTPLVFAALGELVTEKSGVLNLGVEGMMLVGAVASFAVAATTKSPWLGVLAGMAAAAAAAVSSAGREQSVYDGSSSACSIAAARLLISSPIAR